MFISSKMAICLAAILLPVSTHAGQMLGVADVDGGAVNCVVDTNCLGASTASQKSFHLKGMPAVLSSRWYQGATGSPAADKTVYTYNIDLTSAFSATKKVCVTAIQVDFGSVTRLDYRKNGSPYPVFQVSTPGMIGLKGAEQRNNVVRFLFTDFPNALCTGTNPSNGRSTMLFGLAGGTKAQWRNAIVETNEVPPVVHHVAVRVPQH